MHPLKKCFWKLTDYLQCGKVQLFKKQNQSCEDNKTSVHGVSERYSKAAKIVKKQHSCYLSNI